MHGQEREQERQGRPLPGVGYVMSDLLLGTGVLPGMDKGRTDLPQRSERTKTIARALMMTEIRGLPKGLPKEAFIFACITADLGLWDALAEKNPRMADALLRYYTTEAHANDMVSTFPGIATEAGAYKLLSRARKFLWDALPDQPTEAFPYQKVVVFPPERLLKSPPGAGEASRRHWADPEWRAQAEERLRRLHEQNAVRRSRPWERKPER